MHRNAPIATLRIIVMAPERQSAALAARAAPASCIDLN